MFNVESIDATYFREKKYFCCVLLVIRVCVCARVRVSAFVLMKRRISNTDNPAGLATCIIDPYK